MRPLQHQLSGAINFRNVFLISAFLILPRWKPCGGAKPVPMFDAAPPGEEGTAYRRYDAYPPYCSTPDEMETRAVPPLVRDDGGAAPPDSKLVHVTALIRHGARTPYAGAPDYQCWDGYWDDAETGVWDCDLKTYISPPATTKEKGRGRVADDGGLVEEELDFLFEKRFDALAISAKKTGNHLNGTCQLGQLLMRGYDQELRNGLHLRGAYVYDGDAAADGHAASDPRMRLWDVTKEEEAATSAPVIGDATKKIYQEPNLRYRADDEQRTLMSGQILLRGLFEQELLSSGDDEAAVIRLHTADYEQDVLSINSWICPRVEDLRREAYESDEYETWANSAEVKAITTFATEELGMAAGHHYLDCLMTTICTDRPLPELLNDYVGSRESTQRDLNMIDAEGSNRDRFERLAEFAVKNYTYPYKYNDASYAKLGMGPLWKEIMANILPIVDPDTDPASGSPPPKLALFSGHDTTLMPLLATLGDQVWSGKWPPYASMIIIEIHELMNSEEGNRYGFRLIYNGNVLTPMMEGCNSEICDAKVLVQQVMPFAKYQERDCAASTPTENTMEEMKEATESLLAAPGGVWVAVSLVFVSMVLGSTITYFWMKRGSQKYRRESTIVVADDDPGIDLPASTKCGATYDKTDFGKNTLT